MAKNSGGTKVSRVVEKKTTISRKYYKEHSVTGEQRHKLHDKMLFVVKNRIDRLVQQAPEKNKEKAQEIMYSALSKVKTWGNSDIFDYLAGEHISDTSFIGYLQSIYKGKIKKYN